MAIRRRRKNRKVAAVFLHRGLPWVGTGERRMEKSRGCGWRALPRWRAVVFSTRARAARILEPVLLLCAAQHVGLDFIAVT